MARNSLVVFLTLFLFFGTTANSEEGSHYELNLEELDLSVRKNTKRLFYLTFDSENSNISMLQAQHIMENLFNNNGNSYGNLTINLGYEHSPQYRFSVMLSVIDCAGKPVRRIARSEILTRKKAESYRLSELLPSFSKIYSTMLKSALQELEREYTTINKQLESAKAAPVSIEVAIENVFNALAANLDNSQVIALVQVAGPDPVESGKILSALTKNFVNSQKNYKIAERQKIDEIKKELDLQSSALFDPASSAVIGQRTGAKVVIWGSLEVNLNKKKELEVRAVSLETWQILAMASVTF